MSCLVAPSESVRATRDAVSVSLPSARAITSGTANLPAAVHARRLRVRSRLPLAQSLSPENPPFPCPFHSRCCCLAGSSRSAIVAADGDLSVSMLGQIASMSVWATHLDFILTLLDEAFPRIKLLWRYAEPFWPASFDYLDTLLDVLNVLPQPFERICQFVVC